MRRFITLLGPVLIGILLARPIPSIAQDGETSPPDGPPFSLPFADPPGPNTWLYEQHYGNTTQAFNFGDIWYAFGQGMHFGVDFEAPCGTPVLAIADGVVSFVDAEGFGAGPHSLVLSHPGTGYTSLYGHLLRQPLLLRGQAVERGDVIALTGDPDGSCGSRPHLHLEIRSADYQTAFNPLPFFDVNWHMLTSTGPFNHNFQQDLDAPHRWMTLETQPDILFSPLILNNYQRPWPPKLELRAPDNPPPYRHLPSLPDAVAVQRTTVVVGRWNVGAWWYGDDPDAVYLIDALSGRKAGVFRQPLEGSPREYLQPAPPDLRSPDGSISIRHDNGTMQITRRSDGTTYEVATGGPYPAVSPDGTRLLWEVVYGEIVPGTSNPGMRVWISDLDGSNARLVYTMSGGYTQWLDDHRLLIARRIQYTPETRLFIMDVNATTPEPELLGSYQNLRDLQIAPGGQHIAFYLPFQEDPSASGVYVQRTEAGSPMRKLPFFGAYRWRDDRSLYTLSYGIDQDAHRLGYVNVITGEHRWLSDPDTLPIRVANGEWSVSPDGTRIVYLDPENYGLYMLTVNAE